MKTYPIADQLTAEDKKKLGFASDEKGLRFMPSVNVHTTKVHAVRTGEFRSPRSGEWYVSGSPAEAYRSPNDLSTPFYICKLVRTAVKR